jgi:ribosomal protein S18 acetylase RimI-like enzyme
VSASYRIAGPDDAAALATLGRETFRETFVEGFRVPYSAADVATYFSAALTAEKVRATMATPDVRWWIAEDEGRAVGFAMAGPCGLPHPEAASHHGELKRLYLLRSHQGTSLGRALFDESVAWLTTTFGEPLWIGVWSGNEKAQRFYARNGFTRVGDYHFPVGETRDHEFILRRTPASSR